MKKRKSDKVKDKNLFGEYIVAIVSILFFIYLIIDLKNNLFISNFDLYINHIFSLISNSSLIEISKFITNLFEPQTFIILSFIVIIYLFIKDRNREALLFLITTSFAFIIGTLMKIIVERARPENILVLERTFSFPSTHALMSVIFFGMLVYLLEIHIKSNIKKTILTVFATIATLIMGLTRIILNAHYFSDVIAGFALGVFLFSIYLILIKKEHFLKYNRN